MFKQLIIILSLWAACSSVQAVELFYCSSGVKCSQTNNGGSCYKTEDKGIGRFISGRVSSSYPYRLTHVSFIAAGTTGQPQSFCDYTSTQPTFGNLKFVAEGYKPYTISNDWEVSPNGYAVCKHISALKCPFIKK